jgi:hypothetical protein
MTRVATNSMCPTGPFTNTDCIQQSGNVSIKNLDGECPKSSLTFKLNYELQNISICPTINTLPDFIYKVNIVCECI